MRVNIYNKYDDDIVLNKFRSLIILFQLHDTLLMINIQFLLNKCISLQICISRDELI
jgi:hypothetical protein